MTEDFEDERVYLDGGAAVLEPYEPPEGLAETPPATKLTYKVLEHEGEMTQKQLREETLMSPRTVREALERLKEMGLVSENVYIPDARQRLYSIEVDGEPGSGELKSVEER